MCWSNNDPGLDWSLTSPPTPPVKAAAAPMDLQYFIHRDVDLLRFKVRLTLNISILLNI